MKPIKVEHEADATAVLAASLERPLPEGVRIGAWPVDGTDLWSVNAVDAEGRAMAGTHWLVGPDGRLWTFSSNPAIHDYDLVRQCVAEIYRSGLSDLVDERVLADRLQALTEQRRRAERDLQKSIQGGELRTPGTIGGCLRD